MRRMILSLALIAPLAFAGDPAVDALKAKFNPQEQILLAGVLSDPAQASDFAKDAASGGSQAVMTKWYGRISAFSSDYLSRQHGYNDKAPEVRYMGEPAEWAMLMDTLRKMEHGSLIDQGKLKIFVGMIDDANSDLKRGDTEAGHKVVNMGRENLVKALNEYLASPNGKAGAAEAARQRQEEEARKKAAAVQPEPAKTPIKTVVPTAEPEKKKVQPVAVVTPQPGDETVGDDALAKKAREQAEQIRKELEQGGDGSRGYTGDRSSGGQGETAVNGGSTAGERTTLAPVGAGTPNLTVKEPPTPGEGDDMAELHKMKEGVKGHKTLYATIGGGLLGSILGGLIGFFLGGPIGLAIGAVAGAAAGAYGGRAIGKKLWG